MKKIHYTDNYLLRPHHPVTVLVIGAGGTGSQVVTNLARMDMALQALAHPGLHVTVFDPDIITQANIGRQLFSEAELGQNKAMAIVTRANRFFGTTWERKVAAIPCAPRTKKAPNWQTSSSPAQTISAHALTYGGF